MQTLPPTQPLRRKQRITTAEFMANRPGVADLPAIVGESYRGFTRIIRLDQFPEEPIVEVVSDERGERFNLLEEPLLDGFPAYMSLVALAELSLKGKGLGDEALDACLSPSEDDLEMVRKFVSKFGLLSWNFRHECFSEMNAVCPLDEDGTPVSRSKTTSRFYEIDLVLGDFKVPKYGNSVSWIFQEALQLRRANELWSSLQHLRLREDIKPLERLWGRRKGTDVRLFDFWPGRTDRWEELVKDSVYALWWFINSHIREAAPAAVLDMNYRWKRGARSVRGPWIKSETHFPSPLIGLWLQFYKDVLRESKSGRRCDECNEIFAPKRVDQRFCSKRCGGRYRQRKLRLKNRSNVRTKGSSDE